ncbi:MAG: hypothetical protein WA615_30975, partial [Bradyrhizobium sp.]|uniref:hypothetical protein n=1 Tax=Bradyrhizobium sp. TaxID=376 RepID=UPI003C7DAED2
PRALASWHLLPRTRLKMAMPKIAEWNYCRNNLVFRLVGDRRSASQHLAVLAQHAGSRKLIRLPLKNGHIERHAAEKKILSALPKMAKAAPIAEAEDPPESRTPPSASKMPSGSRPRIDSI